MVSSTTRKLKKSIKLSDDQIAYLKKEMGKYENRIAITIALKVNPDVLERIIRTGVCHEKTYNVLFPEDVGNDATKLDA